MATETVRETLTPDDVEGKTFTPVRLREGYDMAEVDHFLDEVVATLRKLDVDAEGLRREAVRNSPGLPSGDAQSSGAGTAPPAEADGRMTATEATSAAIRVLQMAQDEADRTRAEAATAAEGAVAEARRRADEIQTQTEAQAARTAAESEQRAAELDEVTRSRRVELFAALEAEQARLSTDVEGLRAFEREYRARLRTYLTEQVGRLDAERGPAGPAADGVTGEHQAI